MIEEKLPEFVILCGAKAGSASLDRLKMESEFGGFNDN